MPTCYLGPLCILDKMTKPTVTAVGRILKPKGNEPRKHQVIKVDADGRAAIVIDRTLSAS